jgi:hypothetical protein
MKKSVICVLSLLVAGCTATMCGCHSGQTDSGQSLKTKTDEVILSEDDTPELTPDEDILPELPPDDGDIPTPLPDDGDRPRPPHCCPKPRAKHGDFELLKDEEMRPHHKKRPHHKGAKKMPEEEKPQTGEDNQLNS